MHTIKTPGYYCCTSNATAVTLKNCPFTEAFTLVVYWSTGYPGAYLSQEYTHYIGNRRAIQNYNADAAVWKKYEFQITMKQRASSHLIASGGENSFCAAFQSRYQYNTNANYMLANGIYKAGKTGLNLPFEGYWIIITFNTSNDFGNNSNAWITQFAISTDTNDKAIYFRRNINYTPTTWEPWNRLVAS